MRLDDLMKIEKDLMTLVVTRRKLGGFDANADAVLSMSEWMYVLVGHIIDAEKDKIAAKAKVSKK
tara:strand:- start:64 stop:258 length:195 start_codon:yes stop_codon:yes gene_type:complete